MLENHKDLEKYTVLFQVGDGQYGNVYKALDRKTGFLVAIKAIDKRGKSVDELRTFYSEIKLLDSFRHPNIVQLIKYLETKDFIYIITEFCNCDLLDYVIKKDEYLKAEEVRTIALQLISGLMVIHYKGVIHHDLKSRNILLGSDGKIKICDFGLSIPLKNNNEETYVDKLKGTPPYMAPELFSKKSYSYKIDFWSLGVILYEIFVGKLPFDGDSAEKIRKKILENEVVWPKVIPTQLKDFLNKLLQKNQNDRMSWEELVNHPFLFSEETEEEMLLRESEYQ
ncbi:hypothetical protein BB558_006778 [Smittium angustum]|uniref:non-specific serine/threonine protein kinase n=1 Tax=Smittium angustum TaxID=133377 RepID=A0A2U1IWU7_SMIAN|nr:hypothetical protein BB558_006778 [Smittium angustum]